MPPKKRNVHDCKCKNNLSRARQLLRGQLKNMSMILWSVKKYVHDRVVNVSSGTFQMRNGDVNMPGCHFPKKKNDRRFKHQNQFSLLHYLNKNKHFTLQNGLC